ncbi:Hypothetical_protein [Hexamita inflata]|uniref:Hypothetical_protein n=1 Tax=Hexamita inflata TaxID=28002 RepID=A0AA86RN06_9EUKA|nr:Hypothetical protein HINF_LOCUS62634 [Hexamita inflata]CAI9974995.1 Hypothetical protein HINF_LOCUS62640 [Hexamita inflata]
MILDSYFSFIKFQILIILENEKYLVLSINQRPKLSLDAATNILQKFMKIELVNRQQQVLKIFIIFSYLLKFLLCSQYEEIQQQDIEFSSVAQCDQRVYLKASIEQKNILKFVKLE